MIETQLVTAVEEELQRQGNIEKGIEEIVDRLVDEASKELHEFVSTVKGYLDHLKNKTATEGKIAEYEDLVLDMQAVKLPVLMYFAADQMEKWGLYSDVSKAEYQEAYDKAALSAKEQNGRVVDMEIAGRDAASTQDWVQKIKARVYSRLKTRLKYADEIFTGLRKIMSKRISEMDTFRKEQAKRLGKDYESDGDNDD